MDLFTIWNVGICFWHLIQAYWKRCTFTIPMVSQCYWMCQRVYFISYICSAALWCKWIHTHKDKHSYICVRGLLRLGCWRSFARWIWANMLTEQLRWDTTIVTAETPYCNMKWKTHTHTHTRTLSQMNVSLLNSLSSSVYLPFCLR